VVELYAAILADSVLFGNLNLSTANQLHPFSLCTGRSSSRCPLDIIKRLHECMAKPAGNVTLTSNEVKYTFPSSPGTKRFARLKVTGP
jgi:hypothetical protein